MNLISLFIAGLLTSNIVLFHFLGLSSFIDTKEKDKNVIYIGTLVTVVTVISSMISYLIYNYVLKPLNIEYLKTVLFMVIIFIIIIILKEILKRIMPKLYENLISYFPIIATNCVILGVALLNISNGYNFYETLIYSVAASLGFLLLIYIFSTIKERIDSCDIPESFKGVPIALIVIAIITLIFSRFIGL